MKIALINNKAEARHGYLNIIDKEPTTDESSIVMEYAICNYLDFADIVFDGEAEEVYIPSLLEFVPQTIIGDYIKKWVAITAIDGTIIIGGIDLLELLNTLSTGKINENELNMILYANDRKGCYSAQQVKAELEAFGLNIEQVSINNGRYTIVGKRK